MKKTIIIIFFLIILIGIGAYILERIGEGKIINNPATITSKKNSSTKDWKTFINSRDGYSLKYPEEEGAPATSGYSELHSYGFNISSDFNGGNGAFAAIQIFNGSLEEAIISYMKVDSKNRIYKQTGDIIIGGKNGKVVNWTYSPEDSVPGKAYLVEYQKNKTLLIYGPEEFLSTINFL